MLHPKSILDLVGDRAARLLEESPSLPRGELETKLKALLQGMVSRLDVVSREEFDSQMLVLERTRARLEALEARVAELEGQAAPTAEPTR